jgi:hypothetical protein
MAKILGESTRYVSDQAMRRKSRQALLAIAMVALGIFIEGILVSTFLPASWLSLPAGLVLLVITCCAVGMVNKLARRKWIELETDRKTARGASGQILVSQTLDKLPETFCIINDLATLQGDFDHVVIGPTGVFILDAIAWRGAVVSDGRGELLLNGQPTEKAVIRQLVSRVLAVREKVLLLAPGTDLRYEAMLVFTAAWVRAKWGTTSHVKCIALEQLFTFIVEKDYGQRLNPEEVSRVAQAFLALARMDPKFGQPAASSPSPATTNSVGKTLPVTSR